MVRRCAPPAGAAAPADLAALLADFEAAAAAGKPQLRDFCRTWNADLLRKVLPHMLPCHLYATRVVNVHAAFAVLSAQGLQARSGYVVCCVTSFFVFADR